MLLKIKRFFSEHLFLKVASLILAIVAWVYIVGELGKGAYQEQALLRRLIPTYGTIAKDLPVKPILVGTPKRHYRVAEDKILVVPDDSFVVGPKSVLETMSYIYTVPIDITGVDETFTKPVPLNPGAPGVYSEKTVVMVTIHVEKE